MRRSQWRRLGLTFLCGSGLLLGTAGCDRSGSKLQESKAPNPMVARSIKRVSTSDLTNDQKSLYRSANLGPAEANAILGGFSFQASSTIAIKRGKQSLRLRENYKLKQQKSGVFLAKMSNSRGKGYEAIWSGKQLFYRPNVRDFRVVSQEADEARRWQVRGIGRWRAVVELFGGHLRLNSEGSGNLLGRSVNEYSIRFRQGATPLSQQEREARLKQGTAWAGAIPDHTRGAAAGKARQPSAAKGRVWIDQETGLVLKVRFSGRYLVGAKPSAVVSVKLKASFTSRSNPTVEMPTKVLKIVKEPTPLDPFAVKKPVYFQPPPEERGKKKRRR